MPSGHGQGLKKARMKTTVYVLAVFSLTASLSAADAPAAEQVAGTEK